MSSHWTGEGASFNLDRLDLREFVERTREAAYGRAPATGHALRHSGFPLGASCRSAQDERPQARSTGPRRASSASRRRERPGRFAARRSLPTENLSLFVEGVLQVKLRTEPETAQELCADAFRTERASSSSTSVAADSSVRTLPSDGLLMLKKLFASIGWGGVKVDTVLDTPSVPVGGTLKGVIQIQGGDVSQRIDAVQLELVVRCIVENDDDERIPLELVVASVRAATELEVAAGEALEFPFALDVPESTPLSLGSTHTELRTRLEVPVAIDPRDGDAVDIRPNRPMASVLEGVEYAGFRLVEAEVEHAPGHRYPLTQELDFEPTGLGDWGIKELELAFRPASDGAVEVELTVDRRGGLFRRGGEVTHRFHVPATGLPPSEVAAAIRSTIVGR